MSIYTTPLQFAYFFGLLFAVLFLLRGLREERLSDKLLGAVMFLLSMEIQDYTFGFSGINYLWEDMDGFPRHFGLAFAPTIYLYLKSQVNRDFKLTWRDLLHYIPYFVYFAIRLFLFLQGKEEMYALYKTSFVAFLGQIENVAPWIMYIVYFYLSLKMYKHYRQWTETQFSDTESVSFDWLRNFIYLIIAGEIFKFLWQLADFIIDMPYEKDWWWHLLTICIICYVGIRGYSQAQPKSLRFVDGYTELPTNDLTQISDISQVTSSMDSAPIKVENPYTEWKPKIEKMMSEDQIYLEPELTLSEMASKLKTNASVLSAAINKNFGKNFNDFINERRIEEYHRQISLPHNRQYTKLSVALDCGFNSKATFNRALKKFHEKIQA
jgi:AraC-like DNA-binding protein